MKKYIFAIFVLGLLFGVFDFVLAQENLLEINFFYTRGCHYCAEEKKFLNELEQQYPQIEIKRFDISKRESIELLKKFYQEYEVAKEEWGLFPITFTSERYFLGFDNIISQEIESCIEKCVTGREQEIKEKITLPIIGEIDVRKYSLPTLAVILGTLDGFNICSLGALILILGLVLALRSRKKTLLFGGLFILTTAIVYGFLIVLWYQIFSFLVPYMRTMEILIGLLGIGAGIYFLRQFIRFRKYGPTCEVGLGKEIISKFSLRFQKFLKEPGSILLLLGSVLLFAGIITIVEFPCSAAVPVVFAGILSQSQLPGLFYLLYIALFLLFYMLDEIIVFLVAFLTMKVWLASSKAITWITLTEAIILFLLGFYYLFGFGALL
ncbi:glutaredoxin family protein [Patescibacteria group bacterium]|nr:glutaredoxin family protein [Patescibacteria group bacterium]